MTGLESGKSKSATADRSFNLFEELEKIDLAEHLFGTDLPIDLAFDNPPELVDYLVLHLRGWGPNPYAAHFLKKLAETHSPPPHWLKACTTVGDESRFRQLSKKSSILATAALAGMTGL
jgi:hypothetical protein